MTQKIFLVKRGNMLVKICGLTNPETAKLAAINGADYIGLLFSSVSPRQVSIDTGVAIAKAARSGGAEVVGVFVDESFDEMQDIIERLNLKVVQLHGDKVRDFCEKLDPKLHIIYVVNDKPLPANLDVSRDFLLFEKITPYTTPFRFFIAGAIDIHNVQDKINTYHPDGVDLSSGVEISRGVKDSKKIADFMRLVRPERFGRFGGRYVPELLIPPLLEVEEAYNTIGQTDAFKAEMISMLKNYIGRPTALTEVKNFAAAIGGKVRVFLKREDLLHTGAHKINNSLGQCLLAKKMGKTRIVAETGAGQHGVATATACAMFGLECIVYMGQVDIERQAPNVTKMKLLGAKVVSVTSGSATLKDAVNDALRDWAESYDNTHYCLGSALGPHPFPKMVADFQSVIGNEAKQQFLDIVGANPHSVLACVGGGSNSIGIFGAFLDDLDVRLIGVEAGGHGAGLGNNAARFSEGTVGVLHGSTTYLLQTNEGQIVDTYSISAGLDYAAVGPQHANLFVSGRAHYDMATDKEALAAFLLLMRTEGIIPALESSHALGYLMSHINEYPEGSSVLVNLSGRGDKDLPSLIASGVLTCHV
jgi:phosphoribosylanthranilate isomerase